MIKILGFPIASLKLEVIVSMATNVLRLFNVKTLFIPYYCIITCK